MITATCPLPAFRGCQALRAAKLRAPNSSPRNRGNATSTKQPLSTLPGPVAASAEALARVLKSQNVPYAIAGPVACHAHGYRRATYGVDVLVNRTDLNKLVAAISGRGWVRRYAGAMRSFKDGENGVNLDVLVSGDFPGDGMPKPVSFPAIQAPVENAVGDTKTVAVEPVIVPPGIAVLPLPNLIELKLASSTSAPARQKDAADVQELIRANNLPYEFVVELDPSVKAEYESSLRYARNALNLTGDAERESQEGILTVIRGLLGGDPPRLRMSRNFSWLSTADSTILSTEQYDDLGLPTLVPGKPETDVCGIPVPKSYAGFALVGSDPDLHADTEDLLSLADVLWDSKKNKAVFVARCSYTYTVDNVTLAAKPYPTRGHVCREASSAPNRADLDVGLLVEPALLTGPNGTCPPDGPGNLCRMCWPCRRKRLPDRPEQARGYRFQVAVDGYGPTWDAIYWKLASNSTVFAVQHEVRYAQWFGPLLEDGANYIATSAPDLAHAVAGCVRDPEWCRRIAMAAARTFRSAFDLGQIERDWTLLLQKLHDGGVLGGTRWAKAAQQRHPLHLCRARRVRQ